MHHTVSVGQLYRIRLTTSFLYYDEAGWAITYHRLQPGDILLVVSKQRSLTHVLIHDRRLIIKTRDIEIDIQEGYAECISDDSCIQP